MGWRYKAGLIFIIIVLVMWVTSAEITQGIFEEYRHPFAMAYLGTSLLVLYLPVAFIGNWLYHFMRCRFCISSDKAETEDKSSTGLESPIKVNGVQEAFGIEHKGSSDGKDDGMDLKLQEEGKALDSEQIIDVDTLKQDRELTTKETATLGFFIAPIWFLTEVRG
ncbi:hypothetical protein F0562_030174 [Nyssa sinensis]|uniref:Uncharacterized protein n=1 Tax=Nyssa sinensis TaxID=561372 RepID=A0A5J5B229_9ASTE|nr:hypothetical protein F0562_030174 [Nyssa sinensis]